MNFDDYQVAASETAIYPRQFAIMYPALGLAAEAGEVANKVKKIYRDKGGRIDDDDRLSIGSEIADVIWYCAALCTDLDLTLSSQARANLDKLNSRLARGVIQGSGDNR